MKAKNLIIVGAGGFGREVYAWARHSFDFEGDWAFGGFLDDDLNALGDKNYPSVVSDIDSYRINEMDYFLCAVGNPVLKEQLVTRLRSRKAKFATLIHPSVVIGDNVVIGEGCILCPRVVLTSDLHLGNFVTLNVASAVGHDVVVGDYVQTSSFCDVTGGVVLGARVFMGSHASVLPKVQVGDDVVIGAGSVVVRNVPSGVTVFGTPAKTLRR